MTEPTPATGAFSWNEFSSRYQEEMNKKKILQFGLLVLIGMLIWGSVSSSLTILLLPDADSLQIYLFNKGPFVVLLLVVMSKFGGLKFYGIERGSGWWFLVPGLPFLLLGILVLFAPNATFGLSMPATVGWILVALFVGIGEECVFRGILWRAFEPRGILVTAFATSALFGAVHLIGLFTDILPSCGGSAPAASSRWTFPATPSAGWRWASRPRSATR